VYREAGYRSDINYFYRTSILLARVLLPDPVPIRFDGAVLRALENFNSRLIKQGEPSLSIECSTSKRLAVFVTAVSTSAGGS
jgi:hypothetical protein